MIEREKYEPPADAINAHDFRLQRKQPCGLPISFGICWLGA